MPGPQEVKTFVDLVTNAAGESDFEHDRILDFEAVCQAFRPIIFNVRPESDFEDLYEACNETSIHTTPDLYNKLVRNFGIRLYLARNSLYYGPDHTDW